MKALWLLLMLAACGGGDDQPTPQAVYKLPATPVIENPGAVASAPHR